MNDRVFEKYSAYVDKYSELCLDAFEYILHNPELGFKEFKTAERLEREFEKLGYTLEKAGDIPGFCAVADTGRPGPRVLVFGELDAVVCKENPLSDHETGAVHACGHCCQTSALLGVAAALKEKGALDGLSGSIKLCAVPAEELLDVSYREGLREKGVIRYFGGKKEFMRRGFFDDCDLAFMIHTNSDKPFKIKTRLGANGNLIKTVTITGKAAHAGGSPHLGRNALYAATNALNAINALRERHIDGEYARVHGIITNGGQMVNAIPSEVKLDIKIRARTDEAISRLNNEVNLAFAACAAAMGCSCHISDRPGYSPVNNDENMLEAFEEIMPLCTDEDKCEKTRSIVGSCSDIGDIMSVMPAIHPYVSGAVGKGHGADYAITSPESAVLFSAKVQLVFLHALLENGAEKARRIVARSDPPFKSIKAYLDYIDTLFKDKDTVVYEDDGRITLSV